MEIKKRQTDQELFETVSPLLNILVKTHSEGRSFKRIREIWLNGRTPENQLSLIESGRILSIMQSYLRQKASVEEYEKINEAICEIMRRNKFFHPKSS